MVQKSFDDVKDEIVSTLNFIYDNPPLEGVDLPLSMLSERDSVWDNHRNNTEQYRQIYSQAAEFEKYAKRLSECSGYLDFGIDPEKGLVLKRSFFCHFRHCPVCQWRKSLYWRAMAYQAYDRIISEYKNPRWVFLTLTAKNCDISDLRSTLSELNKAWQRLSQRKEFKSVLGWIRTTEVTRNPKTNQAHPHFHVVLLVRSSYFTHGYVKQSRWAELWGECMRVNYLPVVDVRAIKPKKGSNGDGVVHAFTETLKYAVKPSDILDLPETNTNTLRASKIASDWLLELTRQVHHLRFVATGGVLKNAFKAPDEITTDEMIVTDNQDTDTETDERRLSFSYYPTKQKYIYNPKNNT